MKKVAVYTRVSTDMQANKEFNSVMRRWTGFNLILRVSNTNTGPGPAGTG